jgi:hypothetical protein
MELQVWNTPLESGDQNCQTLEAWSPEVDIDCWFRGRPRTIDLILVEGFEVMKFQEVKPWVTTQGHMQGRS